MFVILPEYLHRQARQAMGVHQTDLIQASCCENTHCGMPWSISEYDRKLE